MNFTVTSACVGCGACLATCPEAAFRVVAGYSPPLVVLAHRCTGCAACAEVCPVEACVPVAGWPVSAPRQFHQPFARAGAQTRAQP